jgi:hypothetical protein
VVTSGVRTALGVMAAGVALLALCVLSIWHGKTVGLYGAFETPSSIFYWIIVVTYAGVGALSLVFAFKLLWR